MVSGLEYLKRKFKKTATPRNFARASMASKSIIGGIGASGYRVADLSYFDSTLGSFGQRGGASGGGVSHGYLTGNVFGGSQPMRKKGHKKKKSGKGKSITINLG